MVVFGRVRLYLAVVQFGRPYVAGWCLPFPQNVGNNIRSFGPRCNSSTNVTVYQLVWETEEKARCQRKNIFNRSKSFESVRLSATFSILMSDRGIVKTAGYAIITHSAVTTAITIYKWQFCYVSILQFKLADSLFQCLYPIDEIQKHANAKNFCG